MLLFSQLFHFYDNHPMRNEVMKIITQDYVWEVNYSSVLQGVL